MGALTQVETRHILRKRSDQSPHKLLASYSGIYFTSSPRPPRMDSPRAEMIVIRWCGYYSLPSVQIGLVDSKVRGGRALIPVYLQASM